MFYVYCSYWYCRIQKELTGIFCFQVTDVACVYGFTAFAVHNKEKYKLFGCGINTDSQIGKSDNNILTVFQPIKLDNRCRILHKLMISFIISQMFNCWQVFLSGLSFTCSQSLQTTKKWAYCDETCAAYFIMLLMLP